MQFTELPLCNALQEGLEAMNFKETTPVQELAIPVILQKKDVIACAQTGTGKTAAFLLPLLNNLQTEPHDENKVNAIIMAPTRELAQQIDQHMEGFSYFTPFSSVAVYGGNDSEAWDVQKKGLLNGADVVIATPGRLLSHINLYNIDFSGVKYFILDEADRMLDMGFYDDIMKIEKLLPKERQTIMFSATMPPKIQQLAKTILRNPEEITIAIARPPETILQSAYLCYDNQKEGILKHLFKEKKPNKVILFSGSKQKVKDIARTLHKMGLSAGEMHSDLDQAQREHIMHEFRNERVDILVATDIVARGIDIDDITLVINYDVPYDAEDYVHRIGRTARAGDSGMAITFVSPSEQYRFSMIEKFLGKTIYKIPVPAELGEAPAYNPTRESGQRGGSSRSAKGGKKKEGKKSGGTEKTERRGKSENWAEAEKANISGSSEKSEGPISSESVERSASSERTKKSEKTGSEKAERTEGSVSSIRAERSGSSVKAERTGKPKKSGKGRRTGEPETTGDQGYETTLEISGTVGQTNTGSKPKQPKETGPSDKKRVMRTDTGEQPGNQKNRTPRSPEETGDNRKSSKQQHRRDAGEHSVSQGRETSQTSGKQREQGAPRGQNRQKREINITGDVQKRVPVQKSTKQENSASKQAGDQSVTAEGKTGNPETGKKRKWSWWPFGKK
jgi:superfamily II DNA/RNA helicase